MQDKFAQLGAELETELVERSNEIRCALLALVAGCTFFMVGPPGTAKSLLARRIAARVDDAEFFDVALDKFSTPEVLYGPHDLKALKAGRWERVTDHTLVTADFAHIDEIFEASSALLKAMLWALNERVYRHGTTVIPMRLSTVFTSSNTVPTEPRLAALWDRLVIRRVITPVTDPAMFTSMLLADRADKPAPVLSWVEVTQAQVEAARVVLPEKVAVAVFEIRRGLAAENIEPSDRRFVEAMRVARAAAWLAGRNQVTVGDLAVLSDVLWQFPDEVGTVQTVVSTVLDAHVDASVRLLRDVHAIRGQIQVGLGDEDRRRLAEELGGKVRRARTELRALTRAGQDTEAVRLELEATAEEVLVALFDGDIEAMGAPVHRRRR